MKYITENLEPAKVLRYFEDICGIYRPSHGEGEIADYLVAFAEARGLEVLRDELHNVVIKRAGVGEPVVLQGHTDMVCAVERSRWEMQRDGAAGSGRQAASEGDAASRAPQPDCAVAPEKGASDAHAYLAEHKVTPILEGGFLRADGTTLGADNGVAVAIMLALLDSPELRLPPLECVFTSAEETGLFGAKALDGSWLNGRKFINLDSESDGVLTVSCAGGCRMKLTRTLEKARYTPQFALRLDVSGLHGGHSGGEIHLPHENAILLAGRIAGLLRIGGSIAAFGGGEADNAIPRSASAVICYPVEQLRDAAEKRFADLALKLVGEPDAKITLSRIDPPEVSYAASEDAFELLAELPADIQHRDEKTGFVITSLNCGVAKFENGTLTLTYSLRSSEAQRMVELKQKVAKTAEKWSFATESGAEYPGWAYVEDSPLRELVCEVWAEQTGSAMTVEAIHAGLECGLFADKLPGLDAVALGPTIHGCHTPQERLDLASVAKTWKLLVAVLEKLAK